MMLKQTPYYNNIRLDIIELVEGIKCEKILEIGGGGFPTLFKLVDEKINSRGWGIDPVANDFTTDDKRVTIIGDFFGTKSSNFKLQDDFFDLIIAADVIEHIPDTYNFFNSCFKKLQMDGLLVLSVPNIRQIRALLMIYAFGTFPRDSSGLFDDTHLRWFCRKDVIRFAEESGFKLIAHQYVGRFVPSIFRRAKPFEFLALQNLFVFKKASN